MGKLKTILIIISLLLLAGIGVGTAWWFYQQGAETPVAPTAPQSKPQAQTTPGQNTINLTGISFTLPAGEEQQPPSGGTQPPPSPSPSPSLSPSPSPSPKASPTPTTTPTTTPTPTPTATPTSGAGQTTPSTGGSTGGTGGTQTLPQAGLPWPSLILTSSGVIILLLGLVLAF